MGCLQSKNHRCTCNNTTSGVSDDPLQAFTDNQHYDKNNTSICRGEADEQVNEEEEDDAIERVIVDDEDDFEDGELSQEDGLMPSDDDDESVVDIAFPTDRAYFMDEPLRQQKVEDLRATLADEQEQDGNHHLIVVALWHLGACLYDGSYCTDPNYEGAINCWERAAELGNSVRADDEGKGHEQHGEEEAAATDAAAFAENGLGTCHFHGHGGMPPDAEKAVEYFGLAADHGSHIGANNLGVCWECGWGVSAPDWGKAISAYSRAAVLGYRRDINGNGTGYGTARLNLKRLCHVVFSDTTNMVGDDDEKHTVAEQGNGTVRRLPSGSPKEIPIVPQDPLARVQELVEHPPLLRKFPPFMPLQKRKDTQTNAQKLQEWVDNYHGFFQGQAECMFRLGELYSAENHYCEQEWPEWPDNREVRSFQLLVMAAERGHADALCKIGRLLKRGDYQIPQSPHLALACAKLAGDTGSLEAMSLVGEFYRTMDEIKNYQTAWQWDQKAIDGSLTAIQSSGQQQQAHARDIWHENGGAELEPPLRSGAIALLDARWLVNFTYGSGSANGTKNGNNDTSDESVTVLPCRQQLPSEAFLSCDDVIAASTQEDGIHIVTMSYMWLHPDHPDPKRTTLELLAQWCHECLASCVLTDWDAQQPTFAECPRWALFWDYASIYQHPSPKHGVYRTSHENQLFRQGLDCLSTLFAHPQTHCCKVTKLPKDYPSNYNLPKGANCAEYSQRGWPLMESSLVSMSKSASRTQDLCQSVRFADMKRPPPLTPEALREQLQKASFTNAKNDRALVMELYKAEFSSRMQHLTAMDYDGMEWYNDHFVLLAQVIGSGYAPLLQRLNLGLSVGHLGVKGCKALAEALLGPNSPKQLRRIGLNRQDWGERGPVCVRVLAPVLIQTEEVDLSDNHLGIAAWRALAEAAAAAVVRSGVAGVRLRRLKLNNNNVRSQGLAVLAALIVKHLQEIYLRDANLGNEGCLELATASEQLSRTSSESSPLELVDLSANRFIDKEDDVGQQQEEVDDTESSLSEPNREEEEEEEALSDILDMSSEKFRATYEDGIVEEGCVHLCGLLRHCPHLKTLVVSHSALTKRGRELKQQMESSCANPNTKICFEI